MKNKQNKKINTKGFTLLELLVVILIIGILAAVALPQYKLSVDKINFSSYQMWVESIVSAYKRYMIVHNDEPTDIEELDVDFPAEYTKTSPSYQSCVVFDDIFCCINYPKSGFQNGSVSCGNKNYTMAFLQNIITPANADYSTKYCYAKNDKPRAIRLCESMPYKGKGNYNLPTQYSHQTGYTAYSL